MPTWNDLFAVARDALNDEVASNYRTTDADLVAFAKDALREISVYRPDLFAVTAVFNCAAGVLQTLPADAQNLIDVLNVVGGIELSEADYDTMRKYNESWRTATSGPAECWMRFPSNTKQGPNRQFYVSPGAIGSSQQLTVIYVSLDTTTLVGATVFPLPEQFAPAAEAYLIFRAETKDDEHVNSNRAALFRTAFETLLSVSAQTETT